MNPTLTDRPADRPADWAPQPAALELVRHLRVPGTRNLRDVGGYPAGAGRRTRWRTLMRTDALDLLPRTSQDALVAHGLRCVIDLRWDDEIASWPSVFERDRRVTYHHIPLLDWDPVPDHGLEYMYRHVLDERGESLATIVRALLAPGGTPAVIGCAVGKDRTGASIALLLSAVGVPVDVIVADYALTFEAFRKASDDPHVVDWRREAHELECPPAYMEAMLEHLEHRHGGAGALLRRHGIGGTELDALVELLTEVAPAN